jgi:hypothetical protein
MDDLIAKARERETAATPGPWHRHTYGHATVRRAAGQVTRGLFKTSNTDLSYVHDGAPDDDGASVALIGNGPKQTDNADLIVAARNDYPLLLDVLDEFVGAAADAHALAYLSGVLPDHAKEWRDCQNEICARRLAAIESWKAAQRG